MKSSLRIPFGRSLTLQVVLNAVLTSAIADDLFKPEVNCPPFKCSKPGKIPIQKDGGGKRKSGWPFTYGCESSAFDMFSMMGADALKDGGGLEGLTNRNRGNPNKQKLDKCCRERDFSLQVCGRSKVEIEGAYSKCSKKKCKGDQNCDMQSSFGVMMSGGMAEKDKCDEYNKMQKANCECVDEDKYAEKFKKTLGNFYKVFAKDKLPKSGEVDDDFLDKTVYQKFKKGNEPQIWHALFQKYMSKLDGKIRPKPDYGAPPDYGAVPPTRPNLDEDNFDDPAGGPARGPPGGGPGSDYPRPSDYNDYLNDLKGSGAAGDFGRGGFGTGPGESPYGDFDNYKDHNNKGPKNSNNKQKKQNSKGQKKTSNSKSEKKPESSIPSKSEPDEDGVFGGDDDGEKLEL